MRKSLFGFVVAIGSSFSASAFADAYVDVTMPGNDGGSADIHVGDPVALSRVIRAAVDNPILDTASFTEAATDMTTGTMRCASHAGIIDDNVVPPLCKSEERDTLTFHGPAGSVDVLLTLVVDGTVATTAAQPSHTVIAEYEATLTIDDPKTDAIIGQTIAKSEWDYQQDGGAFQSTITDGGGEIMTSLNSQTPTLHVHAVVPVGMPVEIGGYLEVNDTFSGGFEGDTIDMSFGNTARLAITLPAGYTFTSDSGHFLTNPAPRASAFRPTAATV